MSIDSLRFEAERKTTKPGECTYKSARLGRSKEKIKLLNANPKYQKRKRSGGGGRDGGERGVRERN